jgi:hypothetical protein
VGDSPTTATLSGTTQLPGGCPTDTSVEHGVWARYRPGFTSP